MFDCSCKENFLDSSVVDLNIFIRILPLPSHSKPALLKLGKVKIGILGLQNRAAARYCNMGMFSVPVLTQGTVLC